MGCANFILHLGVSFFLYFFLLFSWLFCLHKILYTIGFIHTLAQKEHLPAHIIFYGEGVKYTAKGSEALEDLSDLETRGVKILSCGICVDYYDLTDYLKVGGLTTMSEVIDILSNSDLIVEP